MPTKTCGLCGQEKDASEFYKKLDAKDGLNWACKPCARAYFRERYATKFRKRPILPVGHKYCARCKRVLPFEAFDMNAARHDGLQVYCKDCWPLYQKYIRRTSRTSRFLETEKKKRQRREVPWENVKYLARQFTAMAIRFGYVRKEPCRVCGSEESFAHHTQYERPLDGLEWYCRTHHLHVGHGGHWNNRGAPHRRGRKEEPTDEDAP